MSIKTSTTEYFAAQPAQTLVSSLSDFQNEWRKNTSQSGLHAKMRKSFRMYYGKHFASSTSMSDSDIMRGGDRGEYALIGVNHYRNLIKHTLVLTTNQKPAFNIKASNTDTDSIQQTRLGRNIVEYYYDTKRLGKYLRDAAEMSQIFGKAYVFALWEPSLGRPYTAQDVVDDQGQPVLDGNGEPKRQILYEGDALFETKSPYDVYVDQMAEDFSKIQWACVRTYRNKFDLCEQYLQLAEKIRELPTKAEADLFNYMSFKSSQHTADVPVYYFIHKTSKSMPNGRLVIFCDQDVILYDGPTPYEDKLPLFRIVPGEIFGTTEGYSDFFDLIGIQEAIDVLVSIMFTNQQAQGIQKIWMPSSGNLTATQIAKGLALLKSEPGTKPEPLQLTANAREIFDSIPLLVKAMEDVSGINAVARGDADHSLKSGVALAYVQTMAAQYTSAFQQSWADLLSDVTTFLLWLLKVFAHTDRMIAITGKRNRSAMASFTKDDIGDIERCTVEVGNPITQTVAGRLEIAQDLLQAGQIKTPQDYIQVLESGNLETMLEGPEAQMDLIKKENESLLDGKPVLAMPGDKHLLHMQEHLTTASDPDLRMKAATGDPQAQAVLHAIMNHIQDHMQKYQTQQPIWSMVSGEPPAPPPPGPSGPPTPGGPGPMPPMPPGPPHPPGPPMPPGAHVLHGPKGHPLTNVSQMQAAPDLALSHIPRLPGNLQPAGQMPPSQ